MEDRKKVAALRYSKDRKRAPEVIGTGVGDVAERILEIAKENDIPLYNDERLVNQLIALELGDQIPPELYKVVAEILVFVYRVDKKA
ncbi:EscU/YscU/HrcU family type III secretion system export apparatus switch protein [Alkalicella caledoniensis]|uniref:EscU/YscU/HrcU family type III secretion system export apparatus switch protein n=1 Tax=Alkalicella caledoniensis TaxID=2731377 RepID=A0A7G9WCX4_ALKCA|nr:EscU/YscU/HrcU family type III secretion system export apparatus switch protein [Alkalicella caledoniensis]QNO16536.1 EscU/YscU/HrcU family type III secretion system export apparatus switch protein [Alkalicella caledoniensis]